MKRGKFYEHNVPDYDVRLVAGTEAELLRYRRDMHDLRALALQLVAEFDRIDEPCSYHEHIERLKAHLERTATWCPTSAKP